MPKNKQIVFIETRINEIVLRGELEFWAKGYTLKLKEPFEVTTSYQLQYASPVKYVIKRSVNPTYEEIALVEKSKEMIKELYFNRLLKLS